MSLRRIDTLDRPTVHTAIHSSTLLNCLTEEDLDGLIPQCYMAYAERGQTIWFNGSQHDFFGLVGSGFVKMVSRTNRGGEITAEIMGPGQVFGLLGAIDGGGCPLTAKAVCDLWYCRIPRRDFIPQFTGRPILKDRLLKRTTHRLRQANDMIARMSSGTVEERLAKIMLYLIESYAEPCGEGLILTVPLTRQDLGEMAGTTVETTIRVLSRWQKQGILSGTRRQMVIHDEEALAEILAH